MAAAARAGGLGSSWFAAKPVMSLMFPSRVKSLSWMGAPLIFILHQLAWLSSRSTTAAGR